MEKFDSNINNIDVLIIEDDSFQQIILSDYCNNLGLKVLCIENAEKALCYIPKLSNQHLVISDMELGGKMTGIDIGKLIRKSCKDVFLVGMSSNSNYQESALKIGFDLFFLKPLTPKKLISILKLRQDKKAEVKNIATKL